MEKIAIYPGSFDPVTNGHMDIITRGLKLFDRIIVTILENPSKSLLFTLPERMDLLSDCLAGIDNVEIDSYQGLLVDYAKQRGAAAILRGMRAVSDFEYEFQMALMNRKLEREIQTVFLMTGLRWIFTSSSIIKEAAKFGGDIESMVPPVVKKKLEEKFNVRINQRQS
ncbi:MAG: pantetheine-phosphate adenylyltransferase [Desulfosalsimonadaceae bacterium]